MQLVGSLPMTVSRAFLCSPCRQLVQTSANITRLFAGINLNRKLSFYISFLDFSVTSACLHDQQNRTELYFKLISQATHRWHMRKKLHTKYNSRVMNIISLLCGYIGHDGLIS